MITPFQFLLVVAGVLFGAAGAICLKVGAIAIDYQKAPLEIALQMAGSPYVVGGLALYMVPSFLWIVLLKWIPLSLLQPLMAMTYVVTPLFAALFLSETVSPVRWAGIGLIVAGVAVVTRG